MKARVTLAIAALAGLTARVGAIVLPETTLFEIGNIEPVQSNPTAPSVFTAQPWRVTQLMTYHYFNGGIPAGTIWFVDGLGSNWGPWQATGSAGQGGVSNAYWNVNFDPGFDLPPGTYTIQDSSPTTWSQNAQSGGRGMCRVTGSQVFNPTLPPTNIPGMASNVAWLSWKIDDDPRVTPLGTRQPTPAPIIAETVAVQVASLTGGVHRFEIIVGGNTNGPPEGAGMLCVSPFDRFHAPPESPVARFDWAFDGTPLTPEGSVLASPAGLTVETNVTLPAVVLDSGTHRLGLMAIDGGGGGGMLYTSPFHVRFPSVGGLREIVLDVVDTNHSSAREATVIPVSGSPTVFDATVTWSDFRLRASGTYLLRATGATTDDIRGPWVWTQFDQVVPTYREDLNLTYWPPENFPGVSVTFDGDANFDGTPNGIAFALGIPPDQRAEGFLPGVESDAEYLYFSFRQRTGGTGDPGAGYSVDGISYFVETSATLDGDSWDSGTGVFEVVGTPADNGDGTETVTIRIPQSAAQGLFVRLRCDEMP